MSAPTKDFFRPFSEHRAQLHHRDEDRPHRCPPRGDIVREDEVGGPVYTLFEGWAIRYHRLPHGARQILDIVLPGDTVGIASAVLGTVKHSVQAITTATLCVLQGKGFSDLFAGHPTLALNVLQTRVEEEQRMDVRLSLLGRNTAEQRIAY